MTKRIKTYLILTVIILLSIIAYEYVKPKEINWYPSYAKHHKMPFGTYVFNEQIQKFAPDVKNTFTPPYKYLEQNPDMTGTYVFINDALEFDSTETEKLLEWASKGNTLFIAAENFSRTLLDTLNLETAVVSNINNLKNVYSLQIKNKHLSQNLVHFNKASHMTAFKTIDTLNTSVIGVVDNKTNTVSTLKEAHINIIKYPFGKGQIILSAFPQAFTNYFILKEQNSRYTASLISYLNKNKTIFLDNHYKTGKTFYTSPLYVFLNNKPLKWAYYTMLIGVLIYVLFEGKRKQRAIPVIPPLKNQTIAFTQTVANMYLNKGDHKLLANQKIKHFMDYIRLQFNLPTTTIDHTFLKHLASRSNNTLEDTLALFKAIETLQDKQHITQTELETISKRIDSFKHKNTWKTTT
ncbi:DUF4350 domain-containing protein [Mangrovimonas yunxiaonensis]|uniref:DUF4350 domain-containing protein n=1 Tax=Mangrovimonas yunxiaonensis TaxID=1197477 RepID=UPI000567CCB9|nr:DUF4350 domain-containing protein [Mangrovimonas yunxiaonensis]